MKAYSRGKSNDDRFDLAIAEPTDVILDKEMFDSDHDGPMDNVSIEMKRILDLWAERTGAILHGLGIELDHLHGAWHPIAPSTDLSERLLQVEIIPQMKANALKDSR